MLYKYYFFLYKAVDMLKCYSLISFVQNKESNIQIIHGCNCYTDDYVYCLLLNNYY